MGGIFSNEVRAGEAAPGFGRGTGQVLITSLSKYLLRSKPESAARRSTAANLLDGMRKETASVIRFRIQEGKGLVKIGFCTAEALGRGSAATKRGRL